MSGNQWIDAGSALQRMSFTQGLYPLIFHPNFSPLFCQFVALCCFSDVWKLCYTGTHDEAALLLAYIAPFFLCSLSDAPLDLKIKASMISDMFTVVGK